MRPSKYPLETLAAQRQRQVDDAVKGLASAVSAREAAERRRIVVGEQRVAHEAQAAGVRDAERGALERGDLSAADLARAHAWQLRAEAEAAAIAAEEQRARAAEATSADGQTRAQDQVAARRADADVVAKDRARWSDRERKRADVVEEDAAAEAFRPRR